MTQGIKNMLNLPDLEDENEAEATQTTEIDINDVQRNVELLRDRLAMATGSSHTEDMSKLYKKIVDYADDLMDLGFNMDKMKASSVFENAASLLSSAISAKNGERDAQLKMMKLMLDQRKLDLEEKKLDLLEKKTLFEMGDKAADLNDNAVIVADRNEILRQLRNDQTTK